LEQYIKEMQKKSTEEKNPPESIEQLMEICGNDFIQYVPQFGGDGDDNNGLQYLIQLACEKTMDEFHDAISDKIADRKHIQLLYTKIKNTNLSTVRHIHREVEKKLNPLHNQITQIFEKINNFENKIGNITQNYSDITNITHELELKIKEFLSDDSDILEPMDETSPNTEKPANTGDFASKQEVNHIKSSIKRLSIRISDVQNTTQISENMEPLGGIKERLHSCEEKIDQILDNHDIDELRGLLNGALDSVNKHQDDSLKPSSEPTRNLSASEPCDQNSNDMTIKKLSKDIEQLKYEINMLKENIKHQPKVTNSVPKIDSVDLQTVDNMIKEKRVSTPSLEIIYDNFALNQDISRLGNRLGTLETKLDDLESKISDTNVQQIKPVKMVPKTSTETDSLSFLPSSDVSIEDIADLRSLINKIKLHMNKRIDALNTQVNRVNISNHDDYFNDLNQALTNKIKQIQNQLDQKADINSLEILKEINNDDTSGLLSRFLSLMSTKVDQNTLSVIIESVEDIKKALSKMGNNSNLLENEHNSLKKIMSDEQQKIIDLNQSIEILKANSTSEHDEPVSLEGVLGQLKLHKDWISKNVKEVGTIREWVWRLREQIKKVKKQSETGSREDFFQTVEELRTLIDSKVGLAALNSKVDLQHLPDLFKQFVNGNQAILSGKITDPYKCMSCDRPLQFMTSEASNFVKEPFYPSRSNTSLSRFGSKFFPDEMLEMSPKSKNSMSFEHSRGGKAMDQSFDKSPHHVSLPELKNSEL